jgi:hypothetical protein
MLGLVHATEAGRERERVCSLLSSSEHLCGAIQDSELMSRVVQLSPSPAVTIFIPQQVPLWSLTVNSISPQPPGPHWSDQPC